ncbi:hypothetical protein AX14_013734 [Amanita brunnescens Koide BX004]|nr:hypothetical protein AX14_013734 [Amanita brunnescens Koide BX004]
MTYSYLGSVPLLVIFNVGITCIKYKEGYITVAGGDMIPTPCSVWDHKSREWLLRLCFCFSVGWALEIVTHLEELTFWLFLLNQGPSQRHWFHSWEFRMWYVGSAIAVVGMPVTTLLARGDLTSTLGWILLTGSLASTCTTICFFYVLARFPHFIQQVKGEGAEPTVVVRLITFYQLNQIRVVFRFIYTIPLLIVAADGIQPPFPIVENPFALDVLLMLGGIGCFVSSAITVFVFFPRSISQESGYGVREKPPLNGVTTPSMSALPPHQYDHFQTPSKSGFDMAGYESSVGVRHTHSRSLARPRSVCSCSMESGHNYISTSYETGSENSHVRSQSILSYTVTKTRSVPSRNTMSRSAAPRANSSPYSIERRHSDGANFDGYSNPIHTTRVIGVVPTPEQYLQVPQLHHVTNSTSPIDLLDEDNNQSRHSIRSSS